VRNGGGTTVTAVLLAHDSLRGWRVSSGFETN